MTHRERDRRDHLLAAEAAAGATQADLAQRYGVSDRTVRRALKRVRGSEGSGAASVDLFADRLLALDEAISDLAVARGRATNPRTAIAALRVKSGLMRERFEALDRAGLIDAAGSQRRANDAADRFAEELLAAGRRELDARTGAWLSRTVTRLRGSG